MREVWEPFEGFDVNDMKKPRSVGPTGASRNGKQLAGEDTVQLLLNLALVGLGRDGNLLDQKGTGGVEHLALAKGQFLVALQALKVAETSAISKTEPVLIFSMYSR